METNQNNIMHLISIYDYVSKDKQITQNTYIFLPKVVLNFMTDNPKSVI